MEETAKRKEGESMESEYRFSIIRPSGNDTCLYRGIVTDPEKRKQLNDLIMAAYPHVEQVGFIDTNPNEVTLMMAGGEFCGNATRSTAWVAREGNSGELSMKVSGVENNLRAGVAANGEAFAQMPIYADPENIQEVPEGYIVKMEGITHFITPAPKDLPSLSEDEIKQRGRLKMAELGIDQDAAAGVMYVSNDTDPISIAPVVFVRDIDTLFYETACGSGTTAIGLLQAKLQADSVDILIMQPSGMPIRITVNYDGSTFQDAQIQGPLEQLASGVIETSTGTVIENVTSENQLERVLDEGLSDTYKAVFSGYPYYEKFENDEITSEFTNYMRNGFVSIFRRDGKIVAFEGTCRADTSSVADVVQGIGLDPKKTWYFGDLGVDEEYRRQGIGRKLTQRRLATLSDPVILRTNKYNSQAITLYESLGFEILEGVETEVQQARVDGDIDMDKRIFLLRNTMTYEK